VQVIIEFLTKGMGEAIGSVQKMQKGLHNFIFTGARVDQTTGKLTRSFTGFRMEMLSIMFFGMALTRMFMGMIGPTLEALGVFEMLGVLFQQFLLPVLLPLLPIFLQIFDFFMNLPEPVRAVIGVLIILGAILGFVMLIGAQLMLATAGILTFIAGVGGLAGAAALIGGALSTIGAFLSAIALPLLVLIALAVLLWLAWETNFGNIRGFVKNVMIAIGNIIDGFVKVILGGLHLFHVRIGKFPYFVIEVVRKILEHFGLLPKGAWQAAQNMLREFVKGIRGMAGSVVSAIWSIIPEPFRGWIKGAVGFVGGIASFVGGIASGFKIPFFQQGGVMPHTGLAYLHEGERVIPPGDTFTSNVFSPVINANIASSYDVRNLARELSEYWEFERRERR